MLVLRDNAEAPGEARGGVVAIGNFDGMHRGHQQLLAVAKAEAAATSAPWGLVTFEPHPRALFRPEEPLFRLTPPEMKCRLAGALGADFTAILTFNKTLAGLEPGEFVDRVLVGQFGVSHVVTGYDFHFGRGRKGNPSTMTEFGRDRGFGVTIVDQVTDDDGMAPFSSSSIRSALRHGRVADAAHQLGYWWTVTGPVVEGDRRGREIGFPTANFLLPAGCEPAEGIYAVRVRRHGHGLAGAGYIGKRPTFDTDRTFLEVYLLDFDEDIYGETLDVEFIDYIRGDARFDNAESLIQQMTADCETIRARLANIGKDDPMGGFAVGRLQIDNRL